MRLVLHYRGPLRSNGDALHKHQIRQVFHQQLAVLWTQPALIAISEKAARRASDGAYAFVRDVGEFQFIPLVRADAGTTAELRVVMLRPGPPGGLLTHGGDIDNRLKTLFDALSVPQFGQLPRNITQDERPTYCLLEDDRLVTLVEVRAEQLLEVTEPSVVELTISVRTRVDQLTYSNTSFA